MPTQDKLVLVRSIVIWEYAPRLGYYHNIERLIVVPSDLRAEGFAQNATRCFCVLDGRRHA